MKVAVLSDIHGNHYALEQVLKIAEIEHVSKLLVLGDIVGYYYHPDKVMQMLQDWDYELIKGNHEKILELLLLNKIEPDSIRKKYGRGHQFAIEKLLPGQIRLITTAPERKKIVVDGVNILMCHGTNWDNEFYLYPDSDKDILEKCDEQDTDFVVVGHSHYPFIYRNAHSTLINVGSIGQCRSAGGMATWAVINTANKSFELRSTKYDTSLLEQEVKITDPETKYLFEILKRNNGN